MELVRERIVRGSLSDKIRRGWIKERVGPIQNALEPRSINALELRNLQLLTVTERCVVAPASVKELVASSAKGAKPGLAFVIDQAVAEIEKPCTRATRNDLLKRIEWVKGTRRQPNFRSSRGECRGDRNTIDIIRKGMIGRDEDRRRARSLEIACGDWRKFVMRFRIDIIKVAVNPQLIVADLIFERRIAAPAFLLRERTREGVKVKAGEVVTITE